MDIKVWVRLGWKTIVRALDALLIAGDLAHQRAREKQGTEALHEREEAEAFHGAKRELWLAAHQQEQPQMKNCNDDSVHGNSAPVLVASPKIELSERTLSVIAFGLACGAFVTALWGIHESDFTRRHTEELRIRLEDAQALLLSANCIKPGDAVHGPLANPDRLKEK